MSDQYISSLLGKSEKVLLITRQHVFVLWKAIALETVAIIIIIGGSIGLSFLAGPYTYFGIILALIPLATFISDYLAWANRKFIISNRRVVQVTGYFNKTVIDSSLEKVNDVKMSQSFWGRMFNFGDVEILTASEMGANFFKSIGDPVRFKTTMINAKEALERPAMQQPLSDDLDDIPAIIQQLDQLRKRGILSEEEFQSKKRQLLARLK